MLSSMRGHHLNQPAVLCRILIKLVHHVLSYGCQIWEPDTLQHMFSVDTAIQRTCQSQVETVTVTLLLQAVSQVLDPLFPLAGLIDCLS